MARTRRTKCTELNLPSRSFFVSGVCVGTTSSAVSSGYTLKFRQLTIFESHELDVRLGQIDLPAEVEVSEARRDLAAVSCAQH